MHALILDILLLSGLVALGYLLSVSISLDQTPWFSIGVGFPLGAGIFSWILFLLSWLGINLTIHAISLSLVVLLAVAWGIYRHRSSKRGDLRDPQTKNIFKSGYSRWKWVALIFCGLLVLFSAVIAVGRSYSTWDGIAIWAAKGYGISLEKSIFAGEIWGAHRLDYPLNIPILISLFRSFEGDLLPGSKILFPLFYLSLLAGCYHFWRSREIRCGYAEIGLLYISTIPLVFTHATIGYANFPFSVYLVLGTLIGIEGIIQGTGNLQLLGGLYLGLASWTRPEGIFIVPIVLLATIVAFRLTKGGEIRFLYLIIPSIVVLGAWIIFGRFYGSGELFQSAIQSLRAGFDAGDFHLDSLYLVARHLGRQMLEIKAWGLVVPLAFLIIILQRSKFNPRRYPIPFIALTLTITIALSITGFYYLVSFEGDLRFWLETGVNRMFLPAGLLGAVWLVLFAGVPVKAEISVIE